MKELIKKALNSFYCLLYGIKSGDNNKISIPFKVVNSQIGSIILGNNVELSSGTILMLVNQGAKLSLGNHIHIAHNVQICCAFNIYIKSNVIIGPYVYIADHNHKYEDPNIPVLDQEINRNDRLEVVIDEGTWIGTKVTIAGNVKIGKHCVIGANSVVTKDIPDYCVAAGVPAKILKSYNFETKQWEKVQINN